MNQVFSSALDADHISQQELAEINRYLTTLSACQRLDWALNNLPGAHCISSSFGAQSAALLHMSQQLQPGIPVIFVDTGFLFAETYEFAAQLQARLGLNIVRAQALAQHRWRELDVANLQASGVEAISRYNRVHKVEPMQRALRELGAQTWIAGLRRDQSESRENIEILQLQGGRFKLHPIADWRDRDIGRYLSAQQLPYHPLWEKGYVSIGDRYLTTPLLPGMQAQDTRFFGLKRECGLHEVVA
jgi:phosphoadenosine phosphosulfate reductase